MVAATPSITHVPTMTGGVGQKDLFLFYRDYFANPPSLRMKLLSRTIGEDRVVDELLVTFTHSEAVPWILPGIPPTDEVVHIAMVSIVRVRGGRLVSEHVYWDQASVLVQIGLLDPKVVPGFMRSKGVHRLPAYGAETAAKVVDEDSQPSNELIPRWKDRPKGDPGALPSRSQSKVNGVKG